MTAQVRTTTDNFTEGDSGLRFSAAITFGGAFDLGAVQAGMKHVGRAEVPNTFGTPNALANRHLLGYDWQIQIDSTGSGAGWDPVDCDVIVANPPCSGFSSLTRAEGFRGYDSPINQCMWAVMRYAIMCNPQIVIFESVQQAFTQGVALMRDLHAFLEEGTGEKWTLHHVKHNNLSLGGCALRKRYFWVASRVPFGVEPVELDYIPSVRDCLEDIAGNGLTWEYQPYRAPATRWTAARRSPSGFFDGHQGVNTPGWARAEWVARNLGGWPSGARLQDLCERHYEIYGDLPGDPDNVIKELRGWHYPSVDGRDRTEYLASREFSMGPTQLNRWYADRHAYVITGGALTEYVHPLVLRTFTHREAARIQGFPDDWKISPQRWDGSLSHVWGKGVPVDSGRWIATWARNSILGEPGGMTGKPYGDNPREFLIDVTNDWQKYAPGGDVKKYYRDTKVNTAPLNGSWLTGLSSEAASSAC